MRKKRASFVCLFLGLLEHGLADFLVCFVASYGSIKRILLSVKHHLSLGYVAGGFSRCGEQFSRAPFCRLETEL